MLSTYIIFSVYGFPSTEESIGIRIEDDIQITKDKAVVLSSSIIKEVADIEEMMK